MPANLPPEVIELLERAKETSNLREKIRIYYEVISLTPKHKGTEKFLAEIKRKISELRRELEKKKKVKKGKKGLKKTGIMIGIVGIENSGKSAFLNKFAGTRLKSTEIPFETKEPAIGVIKYKNVDFRFVEIPSFYEGISERGEISSVVRIMDMLLIFLDPTRDLNFQANLIKAELENMKVILGKRKDVKIERMERGGYEIQGLENFEGEKEDIVELLKRYRIYNAKVIINERCNILDIERIVDEGYVFMKYLPVLTKGDLKKVKDGIQISSVTGEGIEKLLESVWKILNIKRIYTKRKGKIAEKPIVFLGKVTVKDVCERIHEDFLKNFKYAKVWGKSVKFQGQKVGLEYELEDGDVVEIFLK